MHVFLLAAAAILKDAAHRLSERLSAPPRHTHNVNVMVAVRDDGDGLEVSWCDCESQAAMTAATTFLCAKRGDA